MIPVTGARRQARPDAQPAARTGTTGPDDARSDRPAVPRRKRCTAGSLRCWFASGLSAWTFVPVIPIEVFGYFDRGRPWRGDWLWTMDWAGTLLFIPGVLVAMTCAIDTGRAMGRRRNLRGETSPNGWKELASLALPGLVMVGLVHLLTAAAYLATNATTAPVKPPPAVLVMLLVQMAGVAFFVALGMVAGWLFGPVLGPIGAATVVFTTTYGGDHRGSPPPAPRCRPWAGRWH
jgi:hypothetical protein